MVRIKEIAGFWLIVFTVVAVLSILASIAIPNVGRMVAKSQVEDRTLELYRVQTAFTEMLYQSISHTLVSVGPTADMTKVCTTDISPLVLSDYLDGVALNSGCSYSFTADGVVMQVVPQG